MCLLYYLTSNLAVDVPLGLESHFIFYTSIARSSLSLVLYFGLLRIKSNLRTPCSPLLVFLISFYSTSLVSFFLLYIYILIVGASIMDLYFSDCYCMCTCSIQVTAPCQDVSQSQD